VIRTIALREILEHLKSVRVSAIVLLVIAIVPLAVIVNHRAYQQRLDNFSRLSTGRRGGFSMTTSGTEGGYPAYRRPSELSALVTGADPYMPAYWSFTSNGLQDGPPAATPRGLPELAGEIDLLFVVRVVIGLLAFLLAFDVVAGERESGTLKAVLAHSVPRAQLLLGKIAGGSATLLMAVLLAFVLAMLTLQIVHVSLFTGRALVAVALFLAASALYAIAFFAIGTLVSCLTASSRTALVSLLVVWVVFVLVIPRLGTVAAQAIRPVDSDQVLGIRLREAAKPFEDEQGRKLEELWTRMSGQPRGMINASLVSVPVRLDYQNQSTQIIEDINRRHRDVINGILRDHERAVESQQALARTLSRLSPAAALGLAAADLAGTGDGIRGEWLRQLHTKQQLLESQLFDLHFGMTIRSGGSASMMQGDNVPGARRPPPDSTLSRFTFQPPAVASVVAGTAPDFIVLLAYVGLPMLFAFFAFLRYDVR
jgi:ABC-type transport system involved in multi-copper enzyme maturation permease subunit